MAKKINKYQKNKEYFSNYMRNYFHKKRKEKGLKTKNRGEYCVRVLARYKDKKIPRIYGVTIPTKMVKKYKLEGKVFKLRISPKGKFILYSDTGEKYG